MLPIVAFFLSAIMVCTTHVLLLFPSFHSLFTFCRCYSSTLVGTQRWRSSLPPSSASATLIINHEVTANSTVVHFEWRVWSIYFKSMDILPFPALGTLHILKWCQKEKKSERYEKVREHGSWGRTGLRRGWPQLGACALSASNTFLPHMCLRKHMIALCKYRPGKKELGSISTNILLGPFFFSADGAS